MALREQAPLPPLPLLTRFFLPPNALRNPLEKIIGVTQSSNASADDEMHQTHLIHPNIHSVRQTCIFLALGDAAAAQSPVREAAALFSHPAKQWERSARMAPWYAPLCYFLTVH